MMEIIELDKVSFSYGTGLAIDGISIKINSGKFVAIIGPNGAGKSTLLKLIAGYLKPDSGLIYFKEKRLRDYKVNELARYIAYLPQTLRPYYDYTVKETILMGRYPYLTYMKLPTKEDNEKAENIIKMLELEGLKDRRLTELSGGEIQRVFIGSTLIQEPEIYLLDEPVSSLDLRHQEIVMSIFKKEVKKGKTVIMVTHNVNLALLYAEEMLLLNSGRLVFYGSKELLLKKNYLENVYDIDLLKINVKELDVPLIIPVLKRESD